MCPPSDKNSKISFSVTYLHVKSHYVTAEQVKISLSVYNYTDTAAGHDISTCSFFFLSNCLMCDMGSSTTNVEIKAILLLSLTVKSETLPESTSVAYSCAENVTFFNSVQWEICSLVVFFIVQYQYNEFHSETNTQKVAVICNIYQNTICNLHHLVSLFRITSQCCHCFHIRLLRFLGFAIILWPTINFNLVSKSYITTENKKFVSPFVKLVLHVCFHVMSGLCCTYLFIYGK